MTNAQNFGLEALNLLNADDSVAEHTNKFTPLKSGDRKVVKILNYGDLMSALTYSIFKKVNTFTPENSPKLSAKGFPVDELTPFDKAWKYYKDQSTDFQDEMSKKAQDFRIKPRFALGFYDLDTLECIVIDFSKQQAADLMTVITKNKEKLNKKAFELEKTGAGTKTKVTLTALDIDDLTDVQEKAFNDAPTEFDRGLFDGLYFVQDEQQMVESLRTAGFDVSLIGYTADNTDESTRIETNSEDDVDPTQFF